MFGCDERDGVDVQRDCGFELGIYVAKLVVTCGGGWRVMRPGMMALPVAIAGTLPAISAFVLNKGVESQGKRTRTFNLPMCLGFDTLR